VTVILQLWAWTAPDSGTASAFAEDLVTHPKSSTVDTLSTAPARSPSGTRQSYLLLAVGIVVALALPFLLQPRATAFSEVPAAAMNGHSPPTTNP
jgi:hypothetical protein